MFKVLRRLFLVALFGGAIFFGVKYREEAGPWIAKVREALDREPGSISGIPQPNPTQLVADEPDWVIPPPPELVKMEPVINKEARVGILGYHDFTDGKSRNDMIINVDDFRDQLQSIKDAELPVISMSEYLAWKRGESDIPEQCVMITIDDGWKATHTLAMNILKEFEFPFTIFLYKNYVGTGGRSLTHDEVRELMNAGAEVGSHSVSHQNMARRNGKNDEEYAAWLKVELEDSFHFLEENFGEYGKVLKVFAYPYGIYSDEVVEMAEEFGYEACFTVNGKKSAWEEPEFEIGRYVVHGTTLANFDLAMNFGNGSVVSSGRKLLAESKNEEGEVEAPLVATWPSEGQQIADRLPEVQLDVSKLDGVVDDSISMRVTGLGLVPHRFDPDTGIISYQVPQRLRTESCGIRVSLRHSGSSETEVIAWNFKIDLLADLLPPEALEERAQEQAKRTSAEEAAPVGGEPTTAATTVPGGG